MAVPLAAGVGALMLLAKAGSAYVDYQKDTGIYKAQIKEYEWNMTTEAITEINELNKLLIDTYWHILQDSDARDEWRLTLSQLDALINAGKEPDNAKRHRMFARLETDSRYIPMYWYYRAQAAHAAAMDTPANQAAYARDIRACAEFYEKYRGFLRRDELYSSILMIDMTHNEYPDDTVHQRLQHIVDNDPQDSTKRSFAALTCMKHGFFDEAIEHLLVNLDAKKFEVLSRRLMADALAAKQDPHGLQALVFKSIQDDSVSNQEVLYQLGKLSAGCTMEPFKPALEGIKVKVDKSIIGDADLQLRLPQKWIMANKDNSKPSLSLADRLRSTSLAKMPAALWSAAKNTVDVELPSTLTLAGQVHMPQKITASSDDGGWVYLYFEKVLDFDAVLAMPEGQEVCFDLRTEHFPIHLRGRLVPANAGEEGTWLDSVADSAKEGIADAVKNTAGFLGKALPDAWNKSKTDEDETDSRTEQPKNLVFVLDEVCTTETCLRLEA
jgi:hypothetical protein